MSSTYRRPTRALARALLSGGLFLLPLSACGESGAAGAGADAGPTPGDAGPVDAPAASDGATPGDGSSADAAEVPEVCLGIDCHMGRCEERLGEPVCICDPHVVGEFCDFCAQRYGGTDCTDCGVGYTADAMGACVEDPCDGVACSDRGTCRYDDAGGGYCDCDTGTDGANCQRCAEGYIGDNCDVCAEGYVEYEGECIIASCFRVLCGDHGVCRDRGGVGVCLCDDGYTGAACDECAFAYTDDGTGTCILDVCFGVDCGFGHCAARGDVGVCLCDDGVTGDACDTCEEGFVPVEGGCANVLPPISAALAGHWDAAAGATFDLNPDGSVSRWTNQAIDNSWLWNTSTSQLPDFILFEPAVRFNGENHYLHSFTDHTMDESYTMYFVLSWDPSAGEQRLLVSHDQEGAGGDGTGYGLFIEILGDGGTVRVTHRGSFQASGGDVVQGDFFAADGSRQLLRVQRSPFLAGTVLTVSNGVSTASVEATEPAFERLAWISVGNRWSSDDRDFKGDIHEIVTTKGPLAVSDRDAIEAYLRVKWEL